MVRAREDGGTGLVCEGEHGLRIASGTGCDSSVTSSMKLQPETTTARDRIAIVDEMLAFVREPERAMKRRNLQSSSTRPVPLLALTLLAVSGCANAPRGVAASEPASPPPVLTDAPKEPADEDAGPNPNPPPASSSPDPDAGSSTAEAPGAADPMGATDPTHESKLEGRSTGAGALVWNGSGGGAGHGFGVGSRPRTGPRARAIPGKPKQTGTALPLEIVQRIVRRNVGSLRYCYERELVKAKDFNASVTLRFVIDAGGDVTNAQVDGSSGHPDLAACLEAVLEAMKFPTPIGGETVSVSYPFVFQFK